MAGVFGREYPQALVAEFGAGDIDNGIVLYEGQLKLHTNAGDSQGNGEAFLRWQPHSELRYEVEVPIDSRGGWNISDHGDYGKLEFVDTADAPSVSIAIESLSASLETGTAKLKGACDGWIDGDNSADVDEVRFHVANFPELRGSPIAHSSSRVSASRSTADLGGKWSVTLDGVLAPQRHKELRASHGSAITHVGSIRRTDSAAFPFNEVTPVVECLTMALSFMRSHWTGPILLSGHKGDDVVCRWFRVCRTTPTRPAQSWVSRQYPGTFAELLPGFYQKWTDPLWGEPIKMACYWYLDACMFGRSVEGAIISTGSVMETLSWAKLFHEDSTTNGSLSAFNAASLTDHAEELLEKYGVHDDVDDHELPYLQQLATDFTLNPRTLSRAVIKSRNLLIHPKPTAVAKVTGGTKTHYDACAAGKHLSALAILAAVGYRGRYLNRISGANYTHEAEEPVPWSTSP